MDKTLIFVDDGFLAKLSKHFGGGKYLRFDRCLFSHNLARKQNLECEKIFYYTAPLFQSRLSTKEEEQRKEGHDKFIKSLSEKGVVIREGRVQRLNIEGRFVYNQKAVDSLAIIDLMSVPLKYPHVLKIIIISSDKKIGS